jgi:hypothetical protein
LITNGDYTRVKNCDCAYGCTEPDYTSEVSHANWPIGNPNYVTPKCYANFKKTNISCLKAFKQNAVAIDVTFNQMYYRRVVERGSFSVSFFKYQFVSLILTVQLIGL